MVILEGRICVQAALQARERKIELILMRNGLHRENSPELFASAEEQKIRSKRSATKRSTPWPKAKPTAGLWRCVRRANPGTAADFLNSSKLHRARRCWCCSKVCDDAQNFGFVIRSAEALGVQAILLKKHLWDFDEAAVSRSSSGAFERMPLLLFDKPEKILPKMHNYDVAIYGCIANVKRRIYDVDLTRGVLLCLGGEKRGLSAAVRSHCDQFIHIPMSTDIGSLSLTHSASIVMAEAMRQRLMRIDDAKQQIEARGVAGE
jgi:23S rRNA (guanosine2251-2'-O)-methyltransferase